MQLSRALDRLGCLPVQPEPRSQWPLRGALPITPNPRFSRITRKHRLYLCMVPCLLRRTTQGFTRNSLVVTSDSYGKPPATGARYLPPQNPTRILVPVESTRRCYFLRFPRYSAGDYFIPWQTEGLYPAYRIMKCLRAQTYLRYGISWTSSFPLKTSAHP